MLRVYRSESPLLNYINCSFYRNPSVHGIHKNDGETIANQVNSLIASMDLSTKDRYLDWVYTWKEVTNILAELNHNFKRQHTLNSIMNELTLSRTIDQVKRDWIQNGKVVTCDCLPKIRREAEHRIETFSVWLSSTLTALYAARATGKLATSAIVMFQRDYSSEPRLLRNAA